VTLRLVDVLSDAPRDVAFLAACLGVTERDVRVQAVALLREGYPVVEVGDALAFAPGTPTPEALAPRGVFGRAYRYVGTTASTQDDVRAWEGAPHGAVVLAERQTAGRGRRGRAWRGAGSALMFSVLLSDDAVLAALPLVPLAAAVALREACGVGGVKWPNDLLAPDGRKLAGVLLEADLRGGRARRAVLGVGLNVFGAPEGAAGLAEFGTVTRAQVLRDALERLEAWLARPVGEVLEAWREVSVTLGRPVQVSTAGGPVCGVARDVDGDGALLVETPDGMVRVTAGDVVLVGSLRR